MHNSIYLNAADSLRGNLEEAAACAPVKVQPLTKFLTRVKNLLR